MIKVFDYKNKSYGTVICNQSLIVLKKINYIQKIILYIGTQKIIYIYI